MSKQPTKRITKRTVDTLKPGETVWDSDVKGFGLRCQKTSKVYVLKTRIKGRQRWFTIGEHGSPWTTETARYEAQRLWGDIRGGVDIANLRAARTTEPSMQELCDRYMEEHAIPHKRPSSANSDKRNIDNHVLPLLGKLDVRDVTRDDIEYFKKAVSDGKTAPKKGKAPKGYQGGGVVKGGTGVANRCLALLSKMFNLAELWGWREEHSNPVRLVAKYPENKRQRFLTTEEIDRLGDVLNEAEEEGTESLYAVAAIRLLLLTGARLSEILTLRWEQVDLERSFIMLTESKTGERPIYLSEAAKDVLTDLTRISGNPYVIVGANADSHMVNLQKPWGRIREAARLEGVRIHDLRHSFASLAASSGASLPLIGKLLGHTQPQTTNRYAHLVADPVKDLNEAIGASLQKALKRPKFG